MQFLQYKDSDIWWHWPVEEGLTVYNVNGGWHEIDENSEQFMCGRVVHAASWADLCKQEGYNPWESEGNQPTREMWIDPDGVMYDCGTWGAHESTAQTILKILFNQPEEYWDAGDQLIERGWIKVSAGPMRKWYEKSGMYANMTDEQFYAYQRWERKYGKV